MIDSEETLRIVDKYETEYEGVHTKWLYARLLKCLFSENDCFIRERILKYILYSEVKHYYECFVFIDVESLRENLLCRKSESSSVLILPEKYYSSEICCIYLKKSVENHVDHFTADAEALLFQDKVELIFLSLLALCSQNFEKYNDTCCAFYLFTNENFCEEISFIINYFFTYFEDLFELRNFMDLLMKIDLHFEEFKYSVPFLLNYSCFVEQFMLDVCVNSEAYVSKFTKEDGSKEMLFNTLTFICDSENEYIDFLQVICACDTYSDTSKVFVLDFLFQYRIDARENIVNLIKLMKRLLLSQRSEIFVEYVKRDEIWKKLFSFIICNFEMGFGVNMDCYELLYLLRMNFVHFSNVTLLYERIFTMVSAEGEIEDLYYIASLSILYNYMLRDDNVIIKKLEKIWQNFVIKIVNKAEEFTYKREEYEFNDIQNEFYNCVLRLFYFLHINIVNQDLELVFDYIACDVFSNVIFDKLKKVDDRMMLYTSIIYNKNSFYSVFIEYLNIIDSTIKPHLNKITNNLSFCVSKNLSQFTSNEVGQRLPLHYIMKIITYKEYLMDNVVYIKNWIIFQILECTGPIFHQITDLIDIFLANCQNYFNSTKSKNMCQLLKLDDFVIQNLFDGSENCFPLKNRSIKICNRKISQFLVCYYMLICEKRGLFLHNTLNSVVLEDIHLLEQWRYIHLKKILVISFQETELFGIQLVSKFHALVAELRPEYFSEYTHTNSFKVFDSISQPLLSCREEIFVSEKVLSEEVQNIDPYSLNGLQCLYVKKLSKIFRSKDSSNDSSLHKIDICDVIVEFLQDYKSLMLNEAENISTSNIIKRAVLFIFHTAFNLFPEILVSKVLKVFLPKSNLTKIAVSPYLSFVNTIKIFEDMFSVEIFLVCLEYMTNFSLNYIYLQMFRIHNKRKLSKKSRDKIKDGCVDTLMELYNSLKVAYKSSIIQLLIESVNMCEAKFEKNDLYKEELRVKVANFIHLNSINDDDLIKVLHYQTYSLNCIEWIVEHVPSIHICNSFIIELFSIKDFDKLEFAFVLYSNLLSKYMLEDLLLLIPYVFKTFLYIFNGFLTSDDRTVSDFERLFSHLNKFSNITSYTKIQCYSLLSDCLNSLETFKAFDDLGSTKICSIKDLLFHNLNAITSKIYSISL